jgi:hypothetical protein
MNRDTVLILRGHIKRSGRRKRKKGNLIIMKKTNKAEKKDASYLEVKNISQGIVEIRATDKAIGYTVGISYRPVDENVLGYYFLSDKKGEIELRRAIPEEILYPCQKCKSKDYIIASQKAEIENYKSFIEKIFLTRTL